jgi:S1-C subfamily serine protease
MAAELGLANEQQGVLITGVVLAGPAEQAGLKGTQRDVDANESQMPVGGDVIVALEGKPIRDFEDLVSELVGYQAGETVDLGIIRDGENLTIPVTLSARPEDLLNQERAQQEPEPREPASAWLGIVGRDVGEVIIDRMALDQDQVGVLVEAVAPNSPAAEAGLEGGSERTLIEGSIVVLGGDIIVSWSDRSIETFEDLRQSLADADPGDTVEIGVLRDGEMRTLEITLGER